MGILDTDEVEKLFPIGSLLCERCVAEADLDPMSSAALRDASLAHVVEVFVSGNGALSESAGPYGLKKGLLTSRFQARFNEVTHPPIYIR
jgi:hypothetical protein